MELVPLVEILSTTENNAFALLDRGRGEHAYFMATSKEQKADWLKHLEQELIYSKERAEARIQPGNGSSPDSGMGWPRNKAMTLASVSKRFCS